MLAGRLPPASATGQIVLTPKVARFFGVGVGGTVRYRFDNAFNASGAPAPGPGVVRPVTRSFRVAAIVQVPPVLVDQADVGEGGPLRRSSCGLASDGPGGLPAGPTPLVASPRPGAVLAGIRSGRQVRSGQRGPVRPAEPPPWPPRPGPAPGPPPGAGPIAGGRTAHPWMRRVSAGGLGLGPPAL